MSSSIETDIDRHGQLSIANRSIWKSDLTDKNETQFLPSSGRIDTAIWMHYLDTNKNDRKKSWTAITQECCEQYRTSPGGNTPQSSSYTATYHPSRKQSKLDEPDMQDTAGEVEDELISDVLLWDAFTWPCKSRAGQLEPTYSNSVRIRDVTLRTCRKQ